MKTIDFPVDAGPAAAPVCAAAPEKRMALAGEVFGAPSYVYREEIFWGQDRLEFLDRAWAK